MRQFPNYYPNAVTGGDPSKRLNFNDYQEFGEMCTGDFSASLRAIGEFIGDASGDCISYNGLPCSNSDQCPDALYGGSTGTCLEADEDGVMVEYSSAENDGVGFCDTGVILRMLQGEGGVSIEENDYCIPDSVNAMRTERPSCVVDPSFYRWVECPASSSAIAFEWTRDTQAEVFRRFAGYDIEVVYTVAPAF